MPKIILKLDNLDSAVQLALKYYETQGIPIPNSAVEYLNSYPPGLSRQVLKSRFNVSTSDFVSKINPKYSKASAEDSLRENLTRLRFTMDSIPANYKSKDSIKVKCLDCGYLHTTTLDSLRGSKLGCPKCKAGNLSWSKRGEELRTLLKSNFDVELISDIPSTQEGVISVRHTCGTVYSSTLVGFVSPSTLNRATCPNCRTTDRRVTHNGITFGSQFEYECYKLMAPFSPEIQVPYSKHHSTSRLWVCDFVLRINDIRYWIEVSNFKQDYKNYFSNIEDKRNFIEEHGDVFLFVTSIKEMKEVIELL